MERIDKNQMNYTWNLRLLKKKKLEPSTIIVDCVY